MNKIDLLLMLLMVIILLGGLFFIFYYFNNIKNECLANPLIYGAKQLEDQMKYDFQGYGFFKVPVGYSIPEISFNSTNMTFKK